MTARQIADRSHGRGWFRDMLGGSSVAVGIAFLLVASVGLPAVWNSHWMWIDDQMVVGQQLWPPDSVLNRDFHEQGREFIARGLYFKFLSIIFPLRPFWYYLVNYITHLCVLALGALIVWRSTRSSIATAICIGAAGVASTGPEVFLTLVKLELQMTLWLVVALLILQRSMSLGHVGRWSLVGLACTTFLSGTLGKEDFVILPAGVAGALVCAALATRRPRIRSPLAAATVATAIGCAAVFLDRWLLGTRGVSEGGYTARLFEFDPTFAALIERANKYFYQTGDVIVLVAAGVVLWSIVMVGRATRRHELRSSEIIGFISALCASFQVLFHIIFLSYVQIYYLYPSAILGIISLGCLWGSWPMVGAEAGSKRSSSGRLGLVFYHFVPTLLLCVVATLTVPTFAMRLYAQSSFAAMQWNFMASIASLPYDSLVLVEFPSNLKIVSNISLMVDRVLGRRDVEIRSALDPAATQWVANAWGESRPVYFGFDYDFGNGWKVGVRGLALQTRDERLTRVAGYGIKCLSLYTQQIFGPRQIEVSRVNLSPLLLTPVASDSMFMLPIPFGYAWELDKISPPALGGGDCPSQIVNGTANGH